MPYLARDKTVAAALRLLTTHGSEKAHAHIRDAVALIEQGTAAASIPNVDYKEARTLLNRASERSWNHAISPFQGRENWESLPRDVQALSDEMSHPEMHTTARLLRKLEASAVAHPMRDAMLVVLRSLAPLAEMVVTLGAHAKKRETRPAAEIVPGYHPPPTVGKAQKRVLALLEGITEDAHAELAGYFRTQAQGFLQAFLAASHAEGDGQQLDIYDYYGDRRAQTYNPEAYYVVEPLLQNTSRGQPFMPVADYQAAIGAYALRIADDIRNDFVHKNFAKLASIVDLKGNFLSGEALGRSVDLCGLTGDIWLGFGDGSSFVARNSVVYAHSSRGKAFRRFPLTFHEARLPDGSAMRRLSQKRMNDHFAVAGRAALTGTGAAA